jgi:hypothetical protein
MIESERSKLLRSRIFDEWSVPSSRITLGLVSMSPLCGTSATFAEAGSRLFAAFAPLLSER